MRVFALLVLVCFENKTLYFTAVFFSYLWYNDLITILKQQVVICVTSENCIWIRKKISW